ncbi:MAG TPA: hypothetical protein VNW99_04570 [Cytophagaceae bacterium]|nr:hypothetical protein [Cytophagaceae bacterium]
MGTAIIYCSVGAFLSFTYWVNLKSEGTPVLSTIFLPSKLIVADSIYGSRSVTFAFLWHLILLIIAWALFFLVFKMIKILWEMK